jgi:hypothetical protein
MSRGSGRTEILAAMTTPKYQGFREGEEGGGMDPTGLALTCAEHMGSCYIM